MMGFVGDCCAVRCTLDDDELLWQLAEEAVELARAADLYGDYAAKKYGDDAFHKRKRKSEDNVLEEMADVWLVAKIFMTGVDVATAKNAAKDRFEVSCPVTPLYGGLMHIACLDLAKATFKFRRAMTKKNPTPISYEEAKENFLHFMGLVLIMIDRLSKHMDAEERMKGIAVSKARRWTNRLMGGKEDGRIHEDREGLLGK